MTLTSPRGHTSMDAHTLFFCGSSWCPITWEGLYIDVLRPLRITSSVPVYPTSPSTFPCIVSPCFVCLFVFFYSCLIFRKRRRNAIRCWFRHVGSFVEIRANGLRLGYVCWQTRNWNGRIVDKNKKVVYLYKHSVGFSLSSWTALMFRPKDVDVKCVNSV